MLSFKGGSNMFMYTVTVHWMRDGEDHLLTHLFKNKKVANLQNKKKIFSFTWLEMV